MKITDRFAALLLASAVVAPTLGAQIQINEFRIDQTSTDNDEYFELSGPANASLDGLTYIVIGDGSGASGTIEAVLDLTGQTLDGNGYFVAAEATFSIGTANLTANLNFENSDNVTHMLLDGFTGADGADLDTNDDGVLDSTPWTSIVDCVALIETVGSGDMVYCATQVGPDGTFVPGHVFRCSGGWMIGTFDPMTDTPGADNTCTAPSAWTDQGNALAGVNGDPALVGTGDLSDGSNNSVDLSNGASGAIAGLFLSLSGNPTPFKGGFLVPVPPLDPVIVSLSGSGTFGLPFVMPSGVPAGTELWVQWAIQDAAAIHGVALSNAVMGLTP